MSRMTMSQSNLTQSAPLQRRKTERKIETWRAPGKVYRARLIMADEQKDGAMFLCDDSVKIEQYYAIAERILKIFVDTGPKARDADPDSYYKMGHRLLKFWIKSLPSHQSYHVVQPHLQELRRKSREHIMHLMKDLGKLAIIIDRREHTTFQQEQSDKKGLPKELTTPLTNPTSSYDKAMHHDKALPKTPALTPPLGVTDTNDNTARMHETDEVNVIETSFESIETLPRSNKTSSSYETNNICYQAEKTVSVPVDRIRHSVLSSPSRDTPNKDSTSKSVTSPLQNVFKKKISQNLERDSYMNNNNNNNTQSTTDEEQRASHNTASLRDCRRKSRQLKGQSNTPIASDTVAAPHTRSVLHDITTSLKIIDANIGKNVRSIKARQIPGARKSAVAITPSDGSSAASRKDSIVILKANEVKVASMPKESNEEHLIHLRKNKVSTYEDQLTDTSLESLLLEWQNGPVHHSEQTHFSSDPSLHVDNPSGEFTLSYTNSTTNLCAIERSVCSDENLGFTSDFASKESRTLFPEENESPVPEGMLSQYPKNVVAGEMEQNEVFDPFLLHQYGSPRKIDRPQSVPYGSNSLPHYSQQQSLRKRVPDTFEFYSSPSSVRMGRNILSHSESHDSCRNGSRRGPGEAQHASVSTEDEPESEKTTSFLMATPPTYKSFSVHDGEVKKHRRSPSGVTEFDQLTLSVKNGQRPLEAREYASIADTYFDDKEALVPFNDAKTSRNSRQLKTFYQCCSEY